MCKKRQTKMERQMKKGTAGQKNRPCTILSFALERTKCSKNKNAVFIKLRFRFGSIFKRNIKFWLFQRVGKNQIKVV